MDQPFSSPDRTPEFLLALGECERDLFAYVLALSPNWHEAEEVMQKLRLRLWEQYGTHFTPGTDFYAWARSVAWHLMRGHLEELRRRTFSDIALEQIAQAMEETASEVAPRQRALLHCLDQLNDRKRSMLQSFYRDCEPLDQVAQRVGRTPAAVRKSLYRTREFLADCIDSFLARESSR